MNRFIKFFHEILNPHCAHCRQERIEAHEKELESKVCQSCESLKMQIETLRYDGKHLLAALIEKETTPEPVAQQPDWKLLKPNKNIPWTTRRQMLETEDRHAASLREKNKSTEGTPANTTLTELEKELEVAAEEQD